MSESTPTRKNSKLPLWLALVAGLVAIGLALIAVGAYWVYDFSRPISSITVTGQAKTKVKPDQAIARFYLSKRGTDLKVMNEEADIETQKILDYLKSQGIEQSDITTNKNSYPDYSTPIVPQPAQGRAAQRQGEEARQQILEVSFQVILKNLQSDLTKPNTVLSEMVNLGVARFDQLSYEIANREQVCKDLENKAIEDGYRLGTERISNLGGGRITKREVQTSGGCGYDRVYPVMASADMGAAQDSTKAPEVSVGEQELTSTATITLEYK